VRAGRTDCGPSCRRDRKPHLPRSTAVILSGGLDSSVVTAVAARQRLPGPPRSYSAVFPGTAYDESSKIRRWPTPSTSIPWRCGSSPGDAVLALTYARRWQMPLIAAGSLIDIAATGAAAADGAEVVLDVRSAMSCSAGPPIGRDR